MLPNAAMWILCTSTENMCKSTATFLCLEENSLLFFLVIEINYNKKLILTINNCFSHPGDLSSVGELGQS